jgi:mannose-6-phosphate isomerase-like protein (cupin superfamily)
MVRGFEEFRLLQDLADADLVAQIEWADRRADYRERARALLESSGWLAGRPIARFRESEGELSVTHVHDEDELLFVEEGELELAMGYGQALSLGAGEGVLIPRGRLHGSVVRSPSCAYAVAPASE